MTGPPVALHRSATIWWSIAHCTEDGSDRPYLSLDAAASTASLPSVHRRVDEFVPWYSSIHRGAGCIPSCPRPRTRMLTMPALAFAGRAGRDDVAIISTQYNRGAQPPFRLPPRLAPNDESW